MKILIGMSDQHTPPGWATNLLGHELIYAAAQAGDADACVAERHLEIAQGLITADIH